MLRGGVSKEVECGGGLWWKGRGCDGRKWCCGTVVLWCGGVCEVEKEVSVLMWNK